MAFAPRVVSSETIATGHVFDVERLELEAGGATFTREVARHRGAVAVLAYDGERLALVRQWRAPLGRAVLEVVAGTRDVAGEDAASTARRELEEEAGLRAGRLEPLCAVWNSPGWSDQRTECFVATELTEVPRRPSGPEEEALVVVRLALGEALALLDGPDPCDATTATCLLVLERRLRG